MPLIPMPQVGGLDVGGNLLSQSVQRARDNLNLSQDVDGVLMTRCPSEVLTMGGDTLAELFKAGDWQSLKIAPYVGDKDVSSPLLLIWNNGSAPFLNEIAVWDLSLATNLPVFSQSTNPYVPSGTTTPSFEDMDFTELDKIFLFAIQDSNPATRIGVQQFDGVKWHRAGLPQPYIVPSPGVPDSWVRLCYASIDFQANECFGQYVTMHMDRDGSNLIDINPTRTAGTPVTPATEQFSGADRNALDQGFDDRYINFPSPGPVVQVYDSLAQTLTLTAAEHNLVVGNWMQFGIATGSGDIDTIYNDETYDIPYLFAFKVLEVSGLDVVFDVAPANALIYVDQDDWISGSDWAWNSVWATLFASFPFLWQQNSNVWMFAFTSATQTSGYVNTDFRPIAFGASTYTYEINYNIVPGSGISGLRGSPFRVSLTCPRMEDVVDDTTVKIPYPDSVKLLSTFDNLSLAADSQVLYWSDTSTGGSSTMTTGLDNTVPGTSKDGPISGLAAADEFVFVSRLYRNYSVIGTLPTFNFQVNPFSVTTPGTNYFGNVITVGGSIYFGNNLGIWAAAGTNLQSISKAIAGMFFRNSDAHYVAGTSVPLRALALEGSYDSLKGRCLWKISNPADPAQLDWALMLDTKTGEWFRWDGMEENALQIINGLWYTCSSSSAVQVEDLDRTADVVSYHCISWQTAGQPSLEKQFTQIKVFCRTENDEALVLNSYQDWSEEVKTNVVFELDPLYTISQKKKFNSSKSLAISAKISSADSRPIQIEAIEVELNPIQEGMKR